MTIRSAFGCFALFFVPSLAVAQETSTGVAPDGKRRFQDDVVHLGVGSGWALPIGNAESGLSLDEVVIGQVPIAIDASFRALPHVFVGAYASWGFGPAQDCPSDGRCRARGVRFGLNGRYLFEPRGGGPRAAIPWVGLGAGFESLSSRVAATERDYQGISFVDLQLGLDLPVARQFAIGPTLSLSAGEFTRATVEGASSADVEGEIEEIRMHGWFVAGARVVFGS
jgi:hypothetical protein